MNNPPKSGSDTISLFKLFSPHLNFSIKIKKKNISKPWLLHELQKDCRPFFTPTLDQQQGAEAHFTDTRSDFAHLSVIYGAMDKT